MRNPNWKRDEVILALDLYFDPERGSIDKSNPKLIALSRTLNLLPIHGEEYRNGNFRNPSGVSMKLSNFLPFDPNYEGKGLNRGSQLDADVFNEFKDNRNELHQIANRIKDIISDKKTIPKLYEVNDGDNYSEAKEGQVIYRLHKVRERDRKLVKRKKESVFKKEGKLECEVCAFDFYEVYGELGREYIQCHHKTPLSQLDAVTVTQLKDLALVCPNCHVMLHRDGTLSIKKLQKIINKKR